MRCASLALVFSVLLLLTSCSGPGPGNQQASAADSGEALDSTSGESDAGDLFAEGGGNEVCEIDFSRLAQDDSFEAFQKMLEDCEEELAEAGELASQMMGQVAGRFVDSDGAGLELQPTLFRVLEGMSDEDRARAQVYSERFPISATLLDSGGFLIANVFPGTYTMMVMVAGGGAENVHGPFEVLPGRLKNLGDIEVER